MSTAASNDSTRIQLSGDRRLFSARRCVEVALAIVLIAAASLKAYQVLTLSGPVLPGVVHNRTLFAALIEAELFMALWMLTEGLPRARFVAGMICFGIFALAASYEAFRGLDGCGCFGVAKVSPKITAAFDVAALIALWATKPRAIVADCVPAWRIYAATATAVILSGSFLALLVLSSSRNATGAQAGDLVILDPQSWMDKPLEIIADIDSGEPLRHGRWIVVFYHYDCDSCREAIPKYRALAKDRQDSSLGPRLAFVAIPPLAPSALEDPVQASPLYLELKLRPIHDWFATTPVVAALEDGKVLFAADGEQAVSPPKIPQWQ
jgi:hypothetical protein